MQINPHFLFNTLQVISLISMKLLKGDNEVSRSINLLADLLKNALNTDETIVSVRDEMIYAKKYIDIQNIRYGGKIIVEWDIPDEVLDAEVIKMTLQPLLENSIQHGISKLSGGGKIIVSTEIKNGNLIIIVADNGNKIDEDRLRKIKESLKNSKQITAKNIGLSNINQRIKLVFGEEYGCDINSCELGTCVKVVIPYNKKQ